jgi:hypothetical protein
MHSPLCPPKLSPAVALTASKADANQVPSFSPSDLGQLSIPIYEITSLEKKMTALFIPNAIQLTTRQAKYTFASFLSRDTTFDVIYNIWRLARPGEDGVSVVSSGRTSAEGLPGLNGGGPGSIAAGVVATAGGAGAGQAPGAAVAVAKQATQCACGREGKHYSETAMEVVIPGTPEKIHNLMFASGFIKDFMVGNQKLLGAFCLRTVFD